jgi:hypothetical protein
MGILFELPHPIATRTTKTGIAAAKFFFGHSIAKHKIDLVWKIGGQAFAWSWLRSTNAIYIIFSWLRVRGTYTTYKKYGE